MTVYIATDPTRYGGRSGGTEAEGRRLAAFIVAMAEEYIAEHGLVADVRAWDGTGALDTDLGADDLRVADHIEEHWERWIADALDDERET